MSIREMVAAGSINSTQRGKFAHVWSPKVMFYSSCWAGTLMLDVDPQGRKRKGAFCQAKQAAERTLRQALPELPKGGGFLKLIATGFVSTCCSSSKGVLVGYPLSKGGLSWLGRARKPRLSKRVYVNLGWFSTILPVGYCQCVLVNLKNEVYLGIRGLVFVMLCA